MYRRHTEPTIQPYRDNDGAVRYAAAPTASDRRPTLPYDDDFEPLISRGRYTNEDQNDFDGLERFTATGKPLMPFLPNTYVSMSLYAAPQHLPQRYTDDSVIPVVVVLPEDPNQQRVTGGRRKSIMERIRGGKRNPNMKVVFMPRRDYLKHFAKDNEGKYIGTEPQKQWTPEELEDKFGIYKKELGAQRGRRRSTTAFGLNS